MQHDHNTTTCKEGSISLGGAVAMGAGVTIGAGILALTGQISQLAGPYPFEAQLRFLNSEF